MIKKLIQTDKGPSNNKCSKLSEDILDQGKAGGEALAGSKAPTKNKALVQNSKLKTSNYCLTGPKEKSITRAPFQSKIKAKMKVSGSFLFNMALCFVLGGFSKKVAASDFELRVTFSQVSYILKTESVQGNFVRTTAKPGCKSDKVVVDLRKLKGVNNTFLESFKKNVNTAKNPYLVLTEMEGHNGNMNGTIILGGVALKFSNVAYAFNKKTKEIEMNFFDSFEKYKIIDNERTQGRGFGKKFDFIVAVPIKS